MRRGRYADITLGFDRLVMLCTASRTEDVL
jgi:elongation factor P--beta-lysine ligase